MPAASSTRKCLVIACRVSRDPCASCEIERGECATSALTSNRRVSSPSAANTWACSPVPPRLGCGSDMTLDVRQLRAPTALVHPDCLKATLLGDGVKTGFGDEQPVARRNRLKPEFDGGGGLLAVIDGRIHGIGVPAEREQALRLHFLDRDLPFDVLVAGVGDVAPRHAPDREWAVELDAKPGAELTMIGECTPDAGNGRLQVDLLFDAIAHAQPPGCVSACRLARKRATIKLRIGENLAEGSTSAGLAGPAHHRLGWVWLSWRMKSATGRTTSGPYMAWHLGRDFDVVLSF